jgi:hypothetical protein
MKKKNVSKEEARKLTAPMKQMKPKVKITITGSSVGPKKFTPNIGGKSVTQKVTPGRVVPNFKKTVPSKAKKFSK